MHSAIKRYVIFRECDFLNGIYAHEIVIYINKLIVKDGLDAIDVSVTRV